MTRYGLEDGLSWIVPLGLFQKNIFLHFDLRSSTGESLPLISRRVDSAVATRALLVAVERCAPESPKATSRIQQALFSMIFSMEVKPFILIVEELNQRARFTDLERQWLRAAFKCEQFQRLSEALTYASLALARIPAPESDVILKCRRAERMAHNLERVADISRSQANAPYRLVAMDLPDFGWARSDHFQFLAAPGTFITDATNLSLEHLNSRYGDHFSPNRMVFYSHGRRAQAAGFIAYLWPTPRGALRPTLILVIYVASMLLAGAISEYLTIWHACGAVPSLTGTADKCQSMGFLWGLKDRADAALALSFIGPTLTLAYVMKDTDPSVRLELLEKWRHRAVITLIPGLLGSTSLLVDRDLLAPGFLWMTWSTLSVPALYVAVRLIAYWTRIASASKVSRERVSADWSTSPLKNR